MYSAPEVNTLYEDGELKNIISQIKQKKSFIDMYSLGIILYQMIFQGFPYKPQPNDILLFLSYIKKQPFKVQRIPNLNQKIFEIIEGLLIFYPQNRLNFEQFCFKLSSLTNRKSQTINQYSPEGDFNVIKFYIKKQIDLHSQTMNPQKIPFLQSIINTQQWNNFCEQIFFYYAYKSEFSQKYDESDLRFFVSLKCLKKKQHFFNRIDRNQMIQFLNTQ